MNGLDPEKDIDFKTAIERASEQMARVFSAGGEREVAIICLAHLRVMAELYAANLPQDVYAKWVVAVTERLFEVGGIEASIRTEDADARE